MIKTTLITFIPTAIGKPLKSGIYLIAKNGFIQTVHYSAKHKAFNVDDFEDFPVYEIKDVEFWAELPTL